MILFFEMLFTIAIKKLVICGHVIAERTYNVQCYNADIGTLRYCHWSKCVIIVIV